MPLQLFNYRGAALFHRTKVLLRCVSPYTNVGAQYHEVILHAEGEHCSTVFHRTIEAYKE